MQNWNNNQIGSAQRKNVHCSTGRPFALLIVLAALFFFFGLGGDLASAGCGGGGAGQDASDMEESADVKVYEKMSMQKLRDKIRWATRQGSVFKLEGSIENLEMCSDRSRLEAEFVRLRDLMGQKQPHLVKEMESAQRAACYLDVATKTLEIADKTGELVQYTFSVVPVVGAGTSAGLDAGRSFAASYANVIKRGGSQQEAMRSGFMAAMMSGASSFALSKIGPNPSENLEKIKGAKTALNRAKENIGNVYNVAKMDAQNKLASQYVNTTIKEGTKIVAKGLTNAEISAAIGNKIKDIATEEAPPNQTTKPNVTVPEIHFGL